MAKHEVVEKRIEEMLAPIVAPLELEIYDVEYVKEGSDWYLRVYIERLDTSEGGVDIVQCEKVSRALSDLLDQDDFIQDSYILEVSSPGLGRVLKKDKHLTRSIGEEVEIRTYKPINKQKEFVGILKSFDEDKVVIEADEEMTFDRADIALIRLTFDFQEANDQSYILNCDCRDDAINCVIQEGKRKNEQRINRSIECFGERERNQ